MLARPERLDDFLSGLACLGLFAGAYITEILRAGLQSVPASQVEAGRALGHARLGGIPHRGAAARTAQRAPGARSGQFIVSIKDSSLVSLISIQELTFMTSEVSSTTRRFFEAWLFTGLLYFVICFACSLGFRRLERRWSAWA